MARAKNPADGAKTAARFGAFGGVFTPCTLTILGVIMFLRLSEVVGNAGVIAALAIVLMAKVITTITAFSLSALATNTRVKGGGPYYLISRSLGVEYGGAIGIVFFAAQAISVAMYIVGFTEAFLATFPGVGWSPREISTAVNLVCFICVFIGAGWTIRIQYLILAALVASLVSFYIGAGESFSTTTLDANLGPGYVEGQSLFTMFALFFPAVTGIMAGANMSGDLRDPGKAIPRGTLWAILFTGIVYVSLTVFIGGMAPRGDLIGNHQAVRDLSAIPVLITVGVFAATLSSALASMMGAPRILQALTADEIFPVLRPFGGGSGQNNEPRRATVLTFLIAQGAIMLGDLDVIAPIITMFFMLTYGTLNLATFYESVTRNPSYRPTFRFSHWTTALFGAASCLTVMILISPLWAAVAIVVMVALHWYVGRSEVRATWGDLQSGQAFEGARRSLLRLEEEVYHPKNWRPTILALSGGAYNRFHLAEYGYWLTSGRGVLTLAQIIVGKTEEQLDRQQAQEQSLRKFIQDNDLDAFPAVLVAPSLQQGIESLVQVQGIGAFRPNIVLLGWSRDPERGEMFGNTLRTISRFRRSMVVVGSAPRQQEEEAWSPPPGTVDVWWRGRANGPLMLLLAHLLVQSPHWRGHRIRLLRMIQSEAGIGDTKQRLEELSRASRITAEPLVVVGTDFAAALKEHSGPAAAVFLGFDPPDAGGEAGFIDAMNRVMGDLDNVILVHSHADDVHLEA